MVTAYLITFKCKDMHALNITTYMWVCVRACVSVCVVLTTIVELGKKAQGERQWNIVLVYIVNLPNCY